VNEVPEHAREPVPGLPAELPPGERMLWQGRPDTWWFAVRALHVRKVAAYFAVILLLRLSAEGGLSNHVPFLALALSAVGILYFLAWLMVRSTLYTITDSRVVMRFGIAVPISLNLPFAAIDSAEIRKKGRGASDIAIAARPDAGLRLSYAVLWPHARPWRTSPAQPMLRCLTDADEVAALLGDALAAHAAGHEGIAAAWPAARPAGAAPDAAPEPDSFPRPPLYGVGALLAVTILSVALLQLVPETPQAIAPEDIVATVSLDFEDRADGAVLVYDANSGSLIDELPAGSNNFLRATLRGLVRGRESEADRSRAPFDLHRLANGQLLLVDPVTGRTIDLWAFGESNAESFERLLPGAMAQRNEGDDPIQTLASRDEQLTENKQERMQ
jgi:putative photosynthetic complex assembly protein